MISPKISVIMSVYNDERFLDKSISSILGQTFPDFELIIINDGSTDNSLEIIKKYQRIDKRIILIENKRNIGLTKSLNKGIRMAKGKYIARMDSDDIAIKERLQIQYGYLEKNKDTFLIGGGAVNVNKKGERLTIFRPISDKKRLEEKLKKRNAIYHPTIMFRNQGNVFYREKMWYIEDYDLYLRLLSDNKKIVNLKDILIFHRISSDSISIRKNSKQKLFGRKAREFYRQRIKTGRDKYSEFNPTEILKIKDSDAKKVFLKSILEIYLKSRNFKEAKEFLKDYRKTNNISFLETVPYYICCKFPFIYKAYRFLFYRYKT